MSGAGDGADGSAGVIFGQIGTVRKDGKFLIQSGGRVIVDTDIKALNGAYRELFKNY